MTDILLMKKKMKRISDLIDEHILSIAFSNSRKRRKFLRDVMNYDKIVDDYNESSEEDESTDESENEEESDEESDEDESDEDEEDDEEAVEGDGDDDLEMGDAEEKPAADANTDKDHKPLQRQGQPEVLVH